MVCRSGNYLFRWDLDDRFASRSTLWACAMRASIDSRCLGGGGGFDSATAFRFASISFQLASRAVAASSEAFIANL